MKQIAQAVVTLRVRDQGQDTYYLMTHQDGAVQGFASIGDGLAHFEKAYARAHRRGYVASMSACVFMIEFDPRVHKITARRLKDWVKALGWDGSLCTMHGEAGFAHGLKLTNTARVERARRKGAVPKLDSY
jgi:hypothetical protein